MSISIPVQCLVTFLSCVSISIHFNVKGKILFYAALGGAITYFSYAITSPLESVVFQSFVGSLVASIYSESLARILKVPATAFLIICIIPLVPGRNLYYTMKLCIDNDIFNFLTSALGTLGIAGAIALGILLVSSLFRFINVFRGIYYKKKTKL